MSENRIKTRIQQKHDIEANWNLAVNFVPMAGEMIVYDAEIDADGNILTLPTDRTAPYTYERFKIGDGKTKVSDLPFSYYTKAEVDSLLAQKSLVQIITWEEED